MKRTANKNCNRYNCWFCRHNIEAQLEGIKEYNCSETFMPMRNKVAARRLYDEKGYYYVVPEYFMWKDPLDIVRTGRYVGHHVILLGKTGDIRSGEVIAPNSAPTKYAILSDKNIWIRYSKLPDMVLVYPLASITAFIDMETYWNKKKTHPYRVARDSKDCYSLIDYLPF